MRKQRVPVLLAYRGRMTCQSRLSAKFWQLTFILCVAIKLCPIPIGSTWNTQEVSTIRRCHTYHTNGEAAEFWNSRRKLALSRSRRANYNSKASVETIEANLLMKIPQDALSKMTPEPSANSKGIGRQGFHEYHVGSTDRGVPSDLPCSGKSYQLALIVVNAVLRP